MHSPLAFRYKINRVFTHTRLVSSLIFTRAFFSQMIFSYVFHIFFIRGAMSRVFAENNVNIPYSILLTHYEPHHSTPITNENQHYVSTKSHNFVVWVTRSKAM